MFQSDTRLERTRREGGIQPERGLDRQTGGGVVWPVQGMSVGEIQRVGGPMYARSADARTELFRDVDLR